MYMCEYHEHYALVHNVRTSERSESVISIMYVEPNVINNGPYCQMLKHLKVNLAD